MRHNRNKEIKWSISEQAKIYNILDIDIETCKEFTNKVLPTNVNHWESGGGNPSKFWNNVYLSKLAEIGVSRSFNRHNSNQGNCTYPDFAIYDKDNKSFDADLFIHLADERKINLSVKSFPIFNDPNFWSWDINPKDNAYISPTDNDYTALAITDIANKKVYIVNIIANKLIYRLLDDPMCKRDMRCFYYEDYVELFDKAVYAKFIAAKQTINKLNNYIGEYDI